MTKRKRGFTLLELIVAVLIIALLAAVAVPMYKHAVLKSKFSTVMPPTQALAAAQEVFYLNHGDYAEDKEAIDVTLPDTSQTTVTLSNKRNYKYVMGAHTGVPGAHYIMYQKRSKRFADNIHCEADKNDDQAKWLCEKGLNGTPITGSISGSNYLTYLLSGDAGTDKFLRDDCPEGYYDNNGTCKIAPAGSYADGGELIECEPGTYSSMGASECIACPAGRYSYNRIGCNVCPVGTYAAQEGSPSCTPCPEGMYAKTHGHTSCTVCPAGNYSNSPTRCDSCPPGTYSAQDGSTSCATCPDGTYTPNYGNTSCRTCPAGRYTSSPTSCTPCPAGTYSTQEGSPSCTPCSDGTYAPLTEFTSCKVCPNGQTSNADHTGCVPV